ncbi:MAG: T9SS type A sorting domain-containing protein [Ignavibacteria bacterium]
MKKNIHHAIALIFTMAIICVSAVVSDLNAQISSGGEPMSFLMRLNSDFQLVSLQEIDTKKLIEEDKAVESLQGMPFRFGQNIDVNYNLNNSGTWEKLSDGSRIWRLAIRSKDAVSLNLEYKDFSMPTGGMFFVYNLDRTNVFGAFTESNNTSDMQFATSATYGSTTVLEYYEPVYAIGQGSLTVSKVVHAYKDIFGYNSVLEEPCNINVNCPIGAPWVDQKRAVSRIVFSMGGGSFLCTGSLVNNVLNNRMPYYLTAEHCATDNYSTITFYFNYENPTCVGTSGLLNQTMVGAALKASNFDTDFRLILLNQPVPAAYNAYYLGWDNSGAQPTTETSIHHPGGAVKKISVDIDPANTVTGFGGRLVNGFWLVTWDFGMTEGGSSGSPMFDQNQRVIGQNLGGTAANCNAPQSVQKYFGKFSESWAHGGSPTNQAKDWLDPNNTGVTTINGIDDLTGVAPVSNFTSNVQSLPLGGGLVDFFDLTTNGPTSWSWSFPGGNPATSNVRNPGGISYTSTGPYTVSLTTTNSFGQNIKTLVNFISVAGVPLSTFNLQFPPASSRLEVSPDDHSIFQFKWGTANPSPTVSYKFKFKKVGPSPEFIYISDNNGLDSTKSFTKSYLDSLMATFGTTGDSATCSWKVVAFNGLDSITSASFLITIRRVPVGINQISTVVPEQYNLYNNYPNPFNPSTIIKFDISKSDLVNLKIYNMLGEEVATLVDRRLDAGTYEVDFRAGSFASGIYFYRLQTKDFVQTKRMVLTK